VSGTFCAKHPKGEFLAKGTGHVFPARSLDNAKRGARRCRGRSVNIVLRRRRGKVKLDPRTGLRATPFIATSLESNRRQDIDTVLFDQRMRRCKRCVAAKVYWRGGTFPRRNCRDCGRNRGQFGVNDRNRAGMRSRPKKSAGPVGQRDDHATTVNLSTTLCHCLLTNANNGTFSVNQKPQIDEEKQDVWIDQ